ncbi:MAG: hypothetical protein GY873_02530 [Bosea sp.]|uniref:hypothetical protein n=1 Tax=Bosea sp. (in: a-proteobacteria) TaxID=1871050 RepID=UPI00238EF59E|nr:hypothetical protein [Bosea sp. (in: a-proteobacteria)]MCP4733045.1 hypothetical protein [Bosea sp. (in: a-proteobacteria)]
MMKKALGMTACVVAVTALTIIAAALFFGLVFSVLVPDKSVLPGDGSVGMLGSPLGALAIFMGGLHGPMLGYQAGRKLMRTTDDRAYVALVRTGFWISLVMSVLIVWRGLHGAFEAVSYYGPVSLFMIVVFACMAQDTLREMKIGDNLESQNLELI